MWDTLINFWNMGIQSFLIFGDNCRMFLKDMGYFLKKLMGYGRLKPPFQGLMCDIFDLKNIIKTETCFMKNGQPSLVDDILTNQPRLCFGALNFGCGISDWHNMIGVAVRGAAVRDQKQKTKYRSFKDLIKKNLMMMSAGYLFMRHMSSMMSMTYIGRMRSC